MGNNKVIIISGPTASGKTSFSIDLANFISECEIVNFDSLLFYKELNIGTAKPTLEEQAGIPHHLVSSTSINNPINAAEFMRLAEPIIQDIHRRDKICILVGGSGFYLQTLLNGMYESETTSKEIVQKVENLYQKDGINAIRDILKNEDRESYEQYHENDHYRIKRALEHLWMTGVPFSIARKNMKPTASNSPAIRNNWDYYFSYLDIPKPEHNKIIFNRCHEMLKNGLVHEVKEILNNGFSPELKPLKSIGYKETIDYINGVFETESDYIEKLATNTRRLAKAQRTWFKKLNTHKYNSLTDKTIFLNDIKNFIQE